MARRPAPADHQYRVLVEHAPVPIWRAAVDGRCEYVNETWRRFTGRRLEEELGDGWLEAIHPDDRGRRAQVLAEHARRRAPFETEVRLRRADGLYRVMLDRATPFVDEDGLFAGFIGSCIDVDDRRQLERAKATFIGLIAHEIRTPLTSLRALSDVLRRRVHRGDEIGDELFDRLDHQVDAVADLTRDLSDSVLRDAGKQLSLAVGPVDLVQLVRAAVHKQHARWGAAVARRVSFEVSVPDEEIVMTGDASRLGHVLRHLLDNAVKFMPRGGTVEVHLSSTGAEHRLVVKDQGIGVREDELVRLTEPYFRGGNVDAEHYPGIGLGLSLARDVVERHGGRLRFESVLDVGTLVEVVLPARGPAPAGPTCPSAPPAASA